MDFTKPEPSTSDPRSVSYQGYGATLSFPPGQVVIIRKLIHRIVGNRSTAIPWGDVREIRYKDPSAMWNGYIWFVTDADPAELTRSGRQGQAIARSRNAIMFTNRQRDTYLLARKTAEAEHALHRGQFPQR